MKTPTVILLLLVSFSTGFSQTLPYTNLSQLEEKLKANPKPVVIKLFTGWCTYCKMQDRELKNAKEVSSYLEENFYIVNFDAESRDEFTFNGRVYKFKPSGLKTGVHEFALALTPENEVLAYPYWIILNDSLKTLTSYKGYMKSKNLMLLLKSVIENKNTRRK